MPSPESAPPPALRASGPSPRLGQASIQASAPVKSCSDARAIPSPVAGQRRDKPWQSFARRLCRSAIVVLVLAAGLTGCREEGKPSPTPAPTKAPSPAAMAAAAAPASTPAGPVRLVLWHAWLGDRAEQVLQQAAERFHQQYPLITVDPACVGDESDLAVKTVAAVQAGHPPDLAVADGSQVAELMKVGATVPFEPYLNDPEIGLAQEERGDFYPGYWEAGIYREFGNQRLSFPFAKSALAMYYNMALLKRAGLKEAPKTWADLEAACKAVSKGDVIGLAWREDGLTFDGFLYSRGARQLADDQSRATFNGPEGVEALELLIRLSRVNAALRVEEEGAEQGLFAQGKVAFTFGSTSEIASYAEAIKKAGSTFEWGVAMIPQGEATGAPRTVASGTDLCILKTSEARQRAAWQFIRWFAEGEQAAQWAAATGYLPARRSAVAKLAASGYLAQNPLLKEVYDRVVPYAYPEPNIRGEAEVHAAIASAWAAALSGNKASNQALDEAAAKADEVLGKK